MTELIYNREYESLVPLPTSDEFESLRKSIEQNGQFYPIIVNEKYEILDGHTRNKILTYLGITPRYKIMKFDDKLLEKQFVIESNLKRRHLNNYQKIELGIPLLEIEKELAKKRKLSKLNNSQVSTASNDANEGKASYIVAKKIGVSTPTFERGETVFRKAPEHIKEKLRKGSLSVNTAYNLITRKERNYPKTELPKGEFDVIYCDVPISFRDQGGRGKAENHYDTMTEEQLTESEFVRELPFAKNSIIFFWIPASMLKEGMNILYEWEFEYKTNFVWIKDRMGIGYWIRNQHELLLVGVKGKMPTPATLFPSIIDAKREAHSSKPETVYSMIEEMYPRRKYLELFARKRHSEKWTAFGNEVREAIS